LDFSSDKLSNEFSEDGNMTQKDVDENKIEEGKVKEE